MPNASAHLLPEAGAERSEAEAVGSQVQRFVRPGCCEGDYPIIGCSLRSKVEHFKDNAALPFFLSLAKKCRIHRCGNVFFPTIITDLCRYFFKDDGGLVAF
jgi:hypothetical protein